MSRLVQSARTYLNVKWRHLGRSRSGLDCGGLLELSYIDCGVPVDAPKRYGRDPFREGLMSALVKNLGAPLWTGEKGKCKPSILAPGDCVVMSPASQPRHVAIVGDDPMYGLSLIHADGSPGVGKVVEHGISDYFMRQIVAVFRRPV